LNFFIRISFALLVSLSYLDNFFLKKILRTSEDFVFEMLVHAGCIAAGIITVNKKESNRKPHLLKA